MAININSDFLQIVTNLITCSISCIPVVGEISDGICSFLPHLIAKTLHNVDSIDTHFAFLSRLVLQVTSQNLVQRLKTQKMLGMLLCKALHRDSLLDYIS